MSGPADFLAGRSPDRLGRKLEEILDYSDAEIEARHDFIQWLFPLPEASRAVPGSPVLSELDIVAIRASDAARRNLAAAAARMIDFYARNDHWLSGHDHNHLRITRIIRSLRLLLGDAEADAFRARILDRVRTAGAPVNAASREFWQRA